MESRRQQWPTGSCVFPNIGKFTRCLPILNKWRFAFSTFKLSKFQPTTLFACNRSEELQFQEKYWKSGKVNPSRVKSRIASRGKKKLDTTIFWKFLVFSWFLKRLQCEVIETLQQPVFRSIFNIWQPCQPKPPPRTVLPISCSPFSSSMFLEGLFGLQEL